MSHWQGQSALAHRSVSGEGFGTARGFGALGALGAAKQQKAPGDRKAIGRMIKEVVAFMALPNGNRDGSFASSIAQAPSWVGEAAGNTVGVQLRLAVVSATVNRVQLHKEILSGQRPASTYEYVRRAVDPTSRPAQSAGYAILNLWTATLAAGFNATYYLGAWVGQWVTDVGAQVMGQASIGRSDAPSRIRGLYDEGIDKMQRLSAPAAVTYLTRLKRLRIPEDVAGVVMPGGDPSNPKDRENDPVKWVVSALWTNLPTWGKVGVVAGGVGLVAAVAAPYAKIGAALLPTKRKNPRLRRKRARKH